MTVFTNAHILTMHEEPIDNGFVIIKAGKILKVGKMKDLKKIDDMEEIDLQGKILMPGFIDAHSHLGMNEDGVGDEGDDINEMGDPCTPHLRAIDAIDPFDVCFKDALNAGVTSSIVGPGSANPISGQITAIKTYGSSIEEMLIKQTVAVKFAMGENPKKVYGAQDQSPTSRMATAAIIRENLLKTQRYIQDKEKSFEEDEDQPEFEFKYESLIPVLKREVQAHFHAHRAYDIQTAIRIAEEFGLDYVIVHGTESFRIADYLAKKKARVICGPIIGTRSKPELSRQTLDNAGDLLKAGVSIAVSTDHPEVPVQYLPFSLSLLLEHGVTYEQALKSVTVDAAKICGIDHRVGAIKEGMDADIIVFNDKPLYNNNAPERVYINGNRVK